jgi:hypothetical protein
MRWLRRYPRSKRRFVFKRPNRPDIGTDPFSIGYPPELEDDEDAGTEIPLDTSTQA